MNTCYTRNITIFVVLDSADITLHIQYMGRISAFYPSSFYFYALSPLLHYLNILTAVFTSFIICRTRYGTIVSVVDDESYLVSVTIVSPFQSKSPGGTRGPGDITPSGLASSCVCLHLSVKDVRLVD